ncbi:hypothetical protein [Sandaracinus amylolyticus]|uniref:hypothetical protein n=1 Tax=Sandaracinus amylolyticus TaxID=927083 RepID=UPI001F31E4BC|nr:hypothetical protein [Sandaracinus amylolyticus]UJR85053.1 Hypothetical protein I5071_71320 [Sandaracinus amylolyticus]
MRARVLALVIGLLAGCAGHSVPVQPAPVSSAPSRRCAVLVLDAIDADALGLSEPSSNDDTESDRELARYGIVLGTAREPFLARVRDEASSEVRLALSSDGREMSIDAHDASAACESALHTAITMRREQSVSAIAFLAEALTSTQQQLADARRELAAFEGEHGTAQQREATRAQLSAALERPGLSARRREALQQQHAQLVMGDLELERLTRAVAQHEQMESTTTERLAMERTAAEGLSQRAQCRAMACD